MPAPKGPDVEDLLVEQDTKGYLEFTYLIPRRPKKLAAIILGPAIRDFPSLDLGEREHQRAKLDAVTYVRSRLAASLALIYTPAGIFVEGQSAADAYQDGRDLEDLVDQLKNYVASEAEKQFPRKADRIKQAIGFGQKSYLRPDGCLLEDLAKIVGKRNAPKLFPAIPGPEFFENYWQVYGFGFQPNLNYHGLKPVGLLSD